MVRCQVGSHFIVQAAEQTATPSAVRAGGRVLPQIAVLKSVNSRFFGEGALNQGIFIECGNMAALWKLPVILLCENNQFAMSTRPADVTSVPDLSRRADALGIPAASVDGMDVLAVFDAVSAAVARARTAGGPSFVEAICYRFEGHFQADGLQYRTKEELAFWERKDPIAHWRQRLVEGGVITDAEVERMVQAAAEEVREAEEFAKASALPDPAAAWEDLYA